MSWIASMNGKDTTIISTFNAKKKKKQKKKTLKK